MKSEERKIEQSGHRWLAPVAGTGACHHANGNTPPKTGGVPPETGRALPETGRALPKDRDKSPKGRQVWSDVQIQGTEYLAAKLFILILIYLFVPSAVCQFLCLFFFFLLAGSRAYVEHLIRNIRVERRDAELRVFRHEWVRAELAVENRGLLPAFMLSAADAPGPLPVFRNHKIVSTLPGRARARLVWEGHCDTRGEFALGPAVVRGSDPLGLFSFKLTARETTRLFVYPVYRNVSLRAAGGIPLGVAASGNPLFEDITYRRSLRPYQKGDEPRRINWKASFSKAAGGRAGQFAGLLVNEYEPRASYPLMVFLNANRDDYPVKRRAEFIERAIEAAAALCLKASLERQELGIVMYSSGLEGGMQAVAPAAFTLVPIMERLAVLDWTKNVSHREDCHKRGAFLPMLEQGKRLSYGTRYVYAGPDLGDEAYANLDSLKKQRLTLEYVIIDERAMPALVPGNSRRFQMKERGREIV